jgi:hypothetical protein
MRGRYFSTKLCKKRRETTICWRDWDDIPGEEQLIKTVTAPLLLFVGLSPARETSRCVCFALWKELAVSVTHGHIEPPDM